LLHVIVQHRASLQFPNAHSDGIWSTFWTSNDKILTGSVDEVAKSWCGQEPLDLSSNAQDLTDAVTAAGT
jgi:hypothetical protein